MQIDRAIIARLRSPSRLLISIESLLLHFNDFEPQSWHIVFSKEGAIDVRPVI